MPAAKKVPSMKALTARMKEIQLSFNDIWRFMQAFKDSTTVSEIQVRFCKLDKLWEGFSDVLVEIFAHEDFNPETAGLEKERMEFSDRYYEVKSFLMDKIKLLEEPQAEQSIRIGDVSTHSVIEHVRLPQIKLQTFNGDIDEWLSFRDLFTSLIHWKEDLPEVEKFHYLKGCLQGEPKTLIDPLQITRANYQVAWALLLKRYNNCKQLRKRQVQALFNLPTLNKESVADLHILVEGAERIVKTLDQIVQPEDYKDLLLVNILTARLDPVTRRGWEEVSLTREQDTLVDLMEFLRRRVQVLDCLPSRFCDTKGVQQPLPRQNQPIAKVCNQASGGRCVACTLNHPLYQCPTFQQMEVLERDTLLKTHGLCRNCFRTGHHAKDCISKFSCRICNGRHHTLVCFKSKEGETKVIANVEDNEPIPSALSQESSNPIPTQGMNMAVSNLSVSIAASQCTSQVLLATAVVIVEDDNGNQYKARALLDSGSESNFITERLTQRLKVDREPVNITVAGIGQTISTVKQGLRTLVRSRVSEYARELTFLVLPRITANLPATKINTSRWKFPSGVNLADPAFFQSHGVDMVLGIEAFFEFFESGRKITLGEQLPLLKESVFGWVICGGFSEQTQSSQIRCNISTSRKLGTSTVKKQSGELCDGIQTVGTPSSYQRRKTFYRNRANQWTSYVDDSKEPDKGWPRAVPSSGFYLIILGELVILLGAEFRRCWGLDPQLPTKSYRTLEATIPSPNRDCNAQVGQEEEFKLVIERFSAHPLKTA
ncbi:uncharacterized protein LOC128740418 [Sabethes cyaneus]|uniref:uncharacterized protein LOC128740418 n=1 Tax=Sabethes cyaneus TaxID=53552 RepID=UPI00237D964C|nr:uncharacterized protein LOC128740418 [Sabethes cyaneus]